MCCRAAPVSTWTALDYVSFPLPFYLSSPLLFPPLFSFPLSFSLSSPLLFSSFSLHSSFHPLPNQMTPFLCLIYFPVSPFSFFYIHKSLFPHLLPLLSIFFFSFSSLRFILLPSYFIIFPYLISLLFLCFHLMLPFKICFFFIFLFCIHFALLSFLSLWLFYVLFVLRPYSLNAPYRSSCDLFDIFVLFLVFPICLWILYDARCFFHHLLALLWMALCSFSIFFLSWLSCIDNGGHSSYGIYFTWFMFLLHIVVVILSVHPNFELNLYFSMNEKYASLQPSEKETKEYIHLCNNKSSIIFNFVLNKPRRAPWRFMGSLPVPPVEQGEGEQNDWIKSKYFQCISLGVSNYSMSRVGVGALRCPRNWIWQPLGSSVPSSWSK